MRQVGGSLFIILFLMTTISCNARGNESVSRDVEEVFDSVAGYDFHPLNDENAMTLDRTLKKDGIADLDSKDWKVRLLAVRDLVKLSENGKRITGGA